MWQHGAFYTLGVLLAFWLLAGSLLILRALGEQIGWGFQFQSPAFLVILAFVFFLFACNLFGILEIGASLTSVSNLGRHREGLLRSLMNGVLATIAATPCTAPFMGTAIGVALLQPAHYSVVIFTFLGLGMATPLFLLTLFPKWLQFVPKPGPWMGHLKKFFGIILICVVLWLAWILWLQKGWGSILTLYIGLTIAWYSTRAGDALKKTNLNPKMQRSLIIILALLGLAIALVGAYIIKPPLPKFPKKYSKFEWTIRWQDYSPDLLVRYQREGKPIFLDFTAAWCLSCQVNEKVVFQSADVINKFKELKIVPIKADWTSRDERITKALAEYGKNSIPLYVLYTGQKGKNPIILPEIITPGIVLKALENVK